jgi:trehalose/maltose transport system substrate-binding protein
VIWPGVLAENLLDLKAFVPAQEIATHFPGLIANNTVNGKLVALPSLIDVGLLTYLPSRVSNEQRSSVRDWHKLRLGWGSRFPRDLGTN